MKRFFAQRPLPSMMMATCRGTAAAVGTCRVELVKSAMRPAISSGARSNLHQLGLFLGEHLVDFSNVAIGQLLDVILRLALVILRNFMLFQRIL